ncbi:MAG: UDP-N-acetylmuramoyl-tripeptide--D-alanyl-D-alanine ligase [Bacteroidales bacterium]|nr:UDP-N-acetylmuramoyl-tripeptide--D-alanyl-D-alanine ligase [Bacteroidales bacterium]
MSIEQLYDEYLKSRIVTTDSRQITPGAIFFALKGANFDGNKFASQALEQGAALCVIDDPDCKTDDRMVLVKDSLATLQDLARYHRQQLDIPVIGITGTNGKTTTKELINAVLSKRYRTWATQGNFNNHLGVPLTLLSMPADTEIAIVEMGANHPFEIEFLCNIANPEYGLITNVGKAHLEGFGSFKGVIKTKTELYKHLAAMAGVIFVNADNEILVERAEKMSQLPSTPSVLPGVVPAFPGVKPIDYCDDFKPRGVNMPMASVVSYGSATGAECKGSFVSANPYLKFYFEDDDNVYTVQSHLIGAYNFDNAMAAVCVGRYFGVELFDIKTAIEEYMPSNNRSQYKETGRNALILDCYNANPSSMRLAVENFIQMKSDNKVVVLGGMKELGSDSKTEHKSLYDLLRKAGFKQIILVGDEFKFASVERNVQWFPSVTEAKEYLVANPISGATILLKGSNSNKMWLLEEVL